MNILLNWFQKRFTYFKWFSMGMIVFYVFIGEPLLSQNMIDSQVDDYYKSALSLSKQKKYKDAIALAEKAARLKKTARISKLLGDLYLQTKNYLKAIYSFKRVLYLDSSVTYINYKIGMAYMNVHQYAKAKDAFEIYMQTAQHVPTRQKVKKALITCEFAIDALKKPIPYNPFNVGKPNSISPEYNPYVSADETFMIYTRMVKRAGRMDEDFYISYKKQGEWTHGTLLQGVNSNQNEGAHTITPNGEIMFLTACNRDDGLGRCDIYISHFISDTQGWSVPKNLGAPINTAYWEGHPSISSDGNTLFFSSDRPDGEGERDLWLSEKTPTGQWSEPINIRPLNTKFAEMSPFIHLDNKTLYFSSDRPQGMGGYDLFVSKLLDTAMPYAYNLGYPLNDFGDQYSIFVSGDGATAYISAERKEGRGQLDIYRFEMPISKQADKVIFLKGHVINSAGQLVKDAEVDMYNLQTNKKVEGFSISNGQFFGIIAADVMYSFVAFCEGYLIYSDRLDLDIEPITDVGIYKEIVLQQIEKNKKLILKNILFKTNDYILDEKSFIELNQVVRFLNTNPDLKINIAGYTDSIGSTDFNLYLSKKRAEAVYNYLIDKNVEKSRLKHIGLGGKDPIASNKTALGRRQNRRTEITIL